MRRLSLTPALMVLATASSSHAQTSRPDYRCIIETQSPADRQAAVSAFADTFTRTAASSKSETQNSKESKAAEANMIKLSKACTFKYHWTDARRIDVEVYTNDYFAQLAGAQALAQKGVSGTSLERIWKQLTPADFRGIERTPGDLSFKARELALLKSEKAPGGSVVEDLTMLYLHFRHDMDVQDAALAKR
jgi:hypothetical protein